MTLSEKEFRNNCCCMHGMFPKKDVKESIKELKEDLDYHNRQPVKGEFSRGFEHCCELFEKRIENVFGSQLMPKEKLE